ncbi:MAG: glycosyltransferase family 4 protein [Kiritimatiellia bacterium]|jgi:glycosyltransferase involved in cell wall biosynthesis
MSRRPRVLFIASQPFFQWRGSPIRLGFDVAALAQNGCDVDFLTLPIGERREVPGVRIVRAPNLFFAKDISIGPSPLKLAFDVVMFFQALGMICRHRYAVVHGVEDCGIIALALARLCRAKAVFEKHSDSKSYKRGFVMSAYAAVERFVMRRVDAVIGTGPGLVAQVEALGCGTPAHHISDIPSSLVEPDAEGVAKARREMAQADDEILALYVGSFAVYQGIELLFNAMPPALARDARLRFIIIGGSEAEIEQWRGWLAERDCDARVSFIGKRPPDVLPCYLAAADILLSPRIAGVNTPLKLLDYLKVSRAIAATDHPANRLILDETTALLAPPDPEAFADAIATLAADADLRERLAANGRRLIDERYNFNVFREGLRACYAAILPEPPKGGSESEGDLP